MRRAFAFVLFVAVLVTAGSHPRLASAQERTHDITPDDYATVNTITRAPRTDFGMLANDQSGAASMSPTMRALTSTSVGQWAGARA